MPNEAHNERNLTLNCHVFPGVLNRPEKDQAIIVAVLFHFQCSAVLSTLLPSTCVLFCIHFDVQVRF